MEILKMMNVVGKSFISGLEFNYFFSLTKFEKHIFHNAIIDNSLLMKDEKKRD